MDASELPMDMFSIKHVPITLNVPVQSCTKDANSIHFLLKNPGTSGILVILSSHVNQVQPWHQKLNSNAPGTRTSNLSKPKPIPSYPLTTYEA